MHQNPESIIFTWHPTTGYINDGDSGNDYFGHAQGSGNETDVYFFHPDHLGSTAFLTNSDGKPYQHFSYMPYGEVLAEYSTGQFTDYKFNGKELDEETSLYYYGARYYDPRTSIWLSVDPLANSAPGWTPYRYCFDNPIRLIDPNGMTEADGWIRSKNGAMRHDPNVHDQSQVVGDGTYVGETSHDATTYYNSDGTTRAARHTLATVVIDGGKMSDHARTMSNPMVQSIHRAQRRAMDNYTTYFLTAMIMGPLSLELSAGLPASSLVSTEAWAVKAAISGGLKLL